MEVILKTRIDRTSIKHIKRKIQNIEYDCFESGKFTKEYVLKNYPKKLTQFLTDKIKKKKNSKDTFIVNNKEYSFKYIMNHLSDLDYFLFREYCEGY